MAIDPPDFDDEFPDFELDWGAREDPPPRKPGRVFPDDLVELYAEINTPIILRRREDPTYPYYRFGRYEVHGCKFGGMGMVLQAYDPDLDRRVAIKLWLNRGSTPSAALMVEARALAKLSDPNVVAIYDMGTWNDRVYFVMEWVDGFDGRKWMKAGRPPWQEIRAVFVQAAKGLVAAHAMGIQHRDFKPSNILIGRDGRVRVCDFGVADISRGDASKDAFGPTAGTLAYMAPERLAGNRGGPQSDQYSLCVSMWEAMFGTRPFAGDTREELLEAIMSRQVSSGPLEVPWLPNWLVEAVALGLMVNPSERYANMQELILSLMLEDEPEGGDEGGGESEPDGGESDGGAEVVPESEGDDEPPVLHQPAQASDGEPEELDGEVVVAPSLGGYGSPVPQQPSRRFAWLMGAAGAFVGAVVMLLSVLPFLSWDRREQDQAVAPQVEEPITPDEVISHIEAGTYDSEIHERWTAENMRRESLLVPTYDDNLRISEAFLQRFEALKERDQVGARNAASHAMTWSIAARTDLALYDESESTTKVSGELDGLDERIREARASLTGG